MIERSVRWRYVLTGLAPAAAMAGLGLRLASLHLGPAQCARENLERMREYSREIPAIRGVISDCRGSPNILALNRAVKDVCVDPALVATNRAADRVVTELAKVLSLAPRSIREVVDQPDRRFAYVRRFVPSESLSGLSVKSLPGVFLQESSLRYYPNGTFMCHVLGFVNYEGVGCGGVEQAMDRYLRGKPGFVESRLDARRQEICWGSRRYIPPMAGCRVVLTIDQNVQHFAEKALDDVMAQHRAKGAWAIVQRVRTGQILAMVSRPAFDLNNFRSVDEPTRLNRAIGYVFEPGSTLKVVTLAAALNENLVTADTVMSCENGTWLFSGRALHDAHPYGNLTVSDGFKKSSNIMHAKLGVKIGEKRMYRYLREFGVGSRSGIDLPGEEGGILPALDDWCNISITRIPIGQGVAVTAQQMLGIVCAVANGGLLMKPYVVAKITREDGTPIWEAQPQVVSRPVTSETAATVRRLMSQVTDEGGTGRRASVEGYEVAGKTGTAQKPTPTGGYSSTAHMASFVGFLPAGNPEIGIIVVVDEPQPVHYGGVVAAPAFAQIAAETVRYLDIPPTEIRIADTGSKPRSATR